MEVDAVLSTGASVGLYRVGRDLRIDEDDLLDRFTDRTRVVYVIHYFGWQQDLGRLAPICRGRGVRLLEDCALALFSACGARGSVASGDARVFSLPKALAITDGGAAVWRTEHEAVPPLRAPGTGRVIRRTLPLVKRSVLRRLRRMGLSAVARSLDAAPGSRPAVEMPGSYYFTESVRGVSMSRCARGSTRRMDRDRIVASRRRNFSRLHDRLTAAGIGGLFRSLPEGVCPLVMPIVVQDRDGVVRDLASRGIEAIPWWAGVHRSIQLHTFPEARFLKRHVVALPVHDQLTESDIDFVSEAAEAAVERAGRAEAALGLVVD